jgi:hypothetical protein
MDKEIHFYRATGPYGFLSNLYKCPVEFEGNVFRSAEDAYQYGKPREAAVAVWMTAAPSPSLCAQVGHSLLPWQVRADWDEVKVDRMRAVVRAKFQQHPDLRAKLIATGHAMLIEKSKMDAFWGIGKSGKGRNMLGQLLMAVRVEITAMQSANGC